MTPRFLRVNLLICWDDHTWDDGQYIDIPADTPADQVENVAAAKWCDAFEAEDHDEQVAYIRLAGVIECDEEEEEEEDA